jgi:hypothetical protein
MKIVDTHSGLIEPAIKSEIETEHVVIEIPVDWDEAKDIQHYREIHGEREGETDRRDYMLQRIETNMEDSSELLNRAICFLLKNGAPDAGTLSLLPVATKVELLRSLISENSKRISPRQQSDYLARFNEDLDRYIEVANVRDKVLQKYLIDPTGTWLLELVSTDDWILTAQFYLDESMRCEHDDCQSPGYHHLQRRE